jgi:hypothetical protein
MKKWLVLLIIVGLLVACGNQEEGNNSDNVATEENQTNEPVESNENEAEEKPEEEELEVVESEYPFPQVEPTGEGNMIISTPSGTSEEGNVPVLFVSEEDLIIQIGLDLENFQGDKQTFIYIDEIFLTTEQAGELTQTSLDLQGNNLKVGKHTVTAVQYENDEPTANVLNFVQAQYEIKEQK